MSTLTTAGLTGLLDNAIDTGGVLDGIKVALFQNNIAVNQQTVWGDLVECDFPGYARSATIAWAGPFPDGSNVAVIGGCVNFASDSGGGDQSCYGVAYILEGSPPTLLLIDLLPVPLNFDINGQFLRVNPKLALGNS